MAEDWLLEGGFLPRPIICAEHLGGTKNVCKFVQELGTAELY